MRSFIYSINSYTEFLLLAFNELELNWLKVDMVPALMEFRGKKELNSHSSTKRWLSKAMEYLLYGPMRACKVGQGFPEDVNFNENCRMSRVN